MTAVASAPGPSGADGLAAELVADLAAVPRELWIGGGWLPSADGRRIGVDDPSTGRRLTDVADATTEDGLAAVAAADAALPAWAATAPRARAEVLRRRTS